MGVGARSGSVVVARVVATRYDKRAYVFTGTVTLASIRLWLKP